MHYSICWWTYLFLVEDCNGDFWHYNYCSCLFKCVWVACIMIIRFSVCIHYRGFSVSWSGSNCEWNVRLLSISSSSLFSSMSSEVLFMTASSLTISELLLLLCIPCTLFLSSLIQGFPGCFPSTSSFIGHFLSHFHFPSFQSHPLLHFANSCIFERYSSNVWGIQFGS